MPMRGDAGAVCRLSQEVERWKLNLFGPVAHSAGIPLSRKTSEICGT